MCVPACVRAYMHVRVCACVCYSVLNIFLFACFVLIVLLVVFKGDILMLLIQSATALFMHPPTSYFPQLNV